MTIDEFNYRPAPRRNKSETTMTDPKPCITEDEFNGLKNGQKVTAELTICNHFSAIVTAFLKDGGLIYLKREDIASIEPLPEPAIGVGDVGTVWLAIHGFYEVLSVLPGDEWLTVRDGRGLNRPFCIERKFFTRTKIAGAKP